MASARITYCETQWVLKFYTSPKQISGYAPGLLPLYKHLVNSYTCSWLCANDEMGYCVIQYPRVCSLFTFQQVALLLHTAPAAVTEVGSSITDCVQHPLEDQIRQLCLRAVSEQLCSKWFCRCFRNVLSTLYVSPIIQWCIYDLTLKASSD